MKTDLQSGKHLITKIYFNRAYTFGFLNRQPCQVIVILNSMHCHASVFHVSCQVCD